MERPSIGPHRSPRLHCRPSFNGSRGQRRHGPGRRRQGHSRAPMSLPLPDRRLLNACIREECAAAADKLAQGTFPLPSTIIARTTCSLLFGLRTPCPDAHEQNDLERQHPQAVQQQVDMAGMMHLAHAAHNVLLRAHPPPAPHHSTDDPSKGTVKAEVPGPKAAHGRRAVGTSKQPPQYMFKPDPIAAEPGPSKRKAPHASAKTETSQLRLALPSAARRRTQTAKSTTTTKDMVQRLRRRSTTKERAKARTRKETIAN